MESGYCTVSGMEERSWGRCNEPLANHTKGWSSHKEGDVVYMVGLEGSPLL